MIDETRIQDFFTWGQLLAHQGRCREAVQVFDQVTDSYPQLFEAWFNKAIVFEQLLDFKGAIDCYYKAVDLIPNDENATRGLAVMLYNGKQFRRARYWLEKAIRNGDRHSALPEMLRRCPPESLQPLVFISYSWANHERVEKQILPLLETAGVEYFIDRNRIPQPKGITFKDIASFATKLKQPSDPVSSFLKNKLSDQTREALVAYEVGKSVEKHLQRTLAEDINAVIKGESLYDLQRFSDVTLQPETKQLLEQNPQGEKLIRLNRLLLEDAYPLEISRNEMPQLRWQIEVAIAQCDAVLFVWSDTASQSSYVRQELCTSLGMIKNLVPVPLDKTPLPNLLQGSVDKGLIVPVGPGDAHSLINAAKAKGELYEQVHFANKRSLTLSEMADGVAFELISLQGGLLPNFAIGKYPVTQGQWASLMGVNPSTHQGDLTRPMETVSWHDVNAFLEKLNSSTKLSYRLPTEAEWEFACRAGSLGNWCFGDDEAKLHEFAWYIDNTSIGTQLGVAAFAIDGTSHGLAETSPHKTNSAFTKRPNDWGVYHMHGNVSEWCSDEVVGQPGNKIVRGGSYRNAPLNLRCAARGECSSDQRLPDVGFRICRGI